MWVSVMELLGTGIGNVLCLGFFFFFFLHFYRDELSQYKKKYTDVHLHMSL